MLLIQTDYSEKGIVGRKLQCTDSINMNIFERADDLTSHCIPHCYEWMTS
jgi:hypothetical protein